MSCIEGGQCFLDLTSDKIGMLRLRFTLSRCLTKTVETELNSGCLAKLSAQQYSHADHFFQFFFCLMRHTHKTFCPYIASRHNISVRLCSLCGHPSAPVRQTRRGGIGRRSPASTAEAWERGRPLRETLSRGRIPRARRSRYSPMPST